MIEFELTEDHKALVQTVREFAQKEVAPYIKEWDEKQDFHPEVLKKMGELNLLGVCIPEEYGGAGFDYISLGLVCEELEAVDTFHARGDVGSHGFEFADASTPGALKSRSKSISCRRRRARSWRPMV